MLCKSDRSLRGGLFETMQQKRVLIVADELESSKRAVMFVADLLGEISGFSVSLVNFTRIPEDSTNGDDWKAAKKEQMLKLLEQYKGVLVSAGFPEDKIGCQVIIEQFRSTAQRIIDFQKEMNFCIIVLGNRELTKEEEVMFGSTAKRLINIGRKNCAVWVID